MLSESINLYAFHFSVEVQRVLFDFGLKKIFNKRLEFRPLYRDFYILLHCTKNEVFCGFGHIY